MSRSDPPRQERRRVPVPRRPQASAGVRDTGVGLTREGPAARFQELVQKLAARDGKVVILIDEYDKPLLGHLGQPTAAEIQRVLKAFYSVVKGTEAQQRFVLLTGVSKFSKVSVFSDLNNLTDLTMSRSTATLLGYTQAELESNFPEHIAALAAALGTAQQAMRQIREKRYFEPYLADGRRITLAGVAFSRRTRNLGRCLIEPV